jgi:hypothetical protein
MSIFFRRVWALVSCEVAGVFIPVFPNTTATKLYTYSDFLLFLKVWTMRAYLEDLQKKLECPVCYEYMLQPIVMCLVCAVTAEENFRTVLCAETIFQKQAVCLQRMLWERLNLVANTKDVKDLFISSLWNHMQHSAGIIPFGAHLHPWSGKDAHGRVMLTALSDIFRKCIICVLKIET